MDKNLGKLRRRPFLFPLVVPVLIFIAVVAVAAWVFDARATTVVVVVRNAEADGATVTPDPGLNVDGRERAARLAKVLAQAKAVRAVDAVFTSEQRAAKETVTPLAESLALPIAVVPSGTWPELPRKILRDHRGEYVLVSGTSGSIATLIEALGADKPVVKDDEYDAMFIVFVPQISKVKVVRVRY
jgi:phosphohistidine phosphatase SixA